VFHFAGEVQYYVEGFLEKNNDTLYTDLEMLMHSSTFAFLPQLFSQSAVSELPADVSSPGARPQAAAANRGPMGRGKVEKTRSINTIATTFKRQLAALESTLLSTRPHYVRCIKPNKLKSPNVFESHMILDQLLYSGVLETVRIRRQGFPYRQPYTEFWPGVMKSKLYQLVPEIAGVVAESLRRFPVAVSPVCRPAPVV
jgi:myosin V